MILSALSCWKDICPRKGRTRCRSTYILRKESRTSLVYARHKSGAKSKMIVCYWCQGPRPLATLRQSNSALPSSSSLSHHLGATYGAFCHFRPRRSGILFLYQRENLESRVRFGWYGGESGLSSYVTCGSGPLSSLSRAVLVLIRPVEREGKI